MEDRMLGEGIARQELNLLFVIDNSGSMSGEKLGAVNNAIRDVMAINRRGCIPNRSLFPILSGTIFRLKVGPTFPRRTTNSDGGFARKKRVDKCPISAA